MDYGRLQRFVVRHGEVAVFDGNGGTHRLHDATRDSQRLVENADEFLWNGLQRSREEMEELVAQSERGLAPGCGECDRLEKKLIAARGLDRKERNLGMRCELPALRQLQEHRQTH